MPRSIALLNFEGVLQSGVHGLRDLDLISQQAFALLGQPAPFHIEEVELPGDTQTSLRGVADIVFVPPIQLLPGMTEAVLSKHSLVINALAGLKSQHGTVVCACCTSVLLLAEAGLLDSKGATTTWWMLRESQARYPGINWRQNDMLVDAGSAVTSSGPFSFLSQFLYLIERDTTPEASRLVAKLALVEPGKPANGIYAVPNVFSNTDSWLLQVQEVIAQGIASGITVAELASSMNMTERTLHRRVTKRTGVSPREFISTIKIEMAKTMLETSLATIVEIATAVGYGDDSSFRSAFSRAVGISPTDYRNRMNSNSGY